MDMIHGAPKKKLSSAAVYDCRCVYSVGVSTDSTEQIQTQQEVSTARCSCSQRSRQPGSSSSIRRDQGQAQPSVPLHCI